MNEKLIYYENRIKQNNELLSPIICDGEHICALRENLSKSVSNDVINKILSNALDSMRFFANPGSKSSKTKILALGKVQSGKTSFFNTTIAYAFDNNYQLCILFGGTKNNLMEQNLQRLIDIYSNNPSVKIHEMKTSYLDRILDDLNKGYKVILVVLKNVSSQNSNLYEVLDISKRLGQFNTLIIDDEADEHTPGAPKMKSKSGRFGITHDIIASILESYNVVTMIFVTATPQANLLLSTVDYLSPDYITLVKPGEDYTGGEAFHDSDSNRHVEIIKDSDDFVSSIPDSYKRALRFFMISTALKALFEPNRKFSMLIHPSSLQRVQNAILDKISEDLDDILGVLSNPSHLFFKTLKEDFHKVYEENFPDCKTNFEMIFDSLLNNLDEYKIFVMNTSLKGKNSIIDFDNSRDIKYKIFVGGNMFGRGITLENLSTTYIYRDSKISAFDTLYQRARWFGYKRDYFDICKVYMTQSLCDKFVAAAESERDLWQAIERCISINVDLKKFPRIFSLNHEKLILTRKTITKTIVIERVKAGYNYDLSIYFEKGDEEKNRILYHDFLNRYKHIAREKDFSRRGNQVHLVITDTFTNIFDNFISKYNFQINSNLGLKTFEKIKEQIANNAYDDLLNVVIMRYKEMQYRSKRPNIKSIKELPQGYDESTGYPGDRNLSGLSDDLQLQIHLVYVDKNKPEEFIPILAFNNPITAKTIKYVTGDNDYESV